jgi:hypothetical protein
LRLLGTIAAMVLTQTLVPGCARRARTADEAYLRFAAAVRSGDGGALFDAVDPETRWAWMMVQKWHREAYDIVLSNYPEGTARDRELRRFAAGATATSGRELFRAETAALLPTLAPLAAGGASIVVDPSGDRATATLPAGQIALRRGENGAWGYAGLAAQADEQRNRAYHDLEMVRASAADYERAATRAAAR